MLYYFVLKAVLTFRNDTCRWDQLNSLLLHTCMTEAIDFNDDYIFFQGENPICT